MLGPRGPVFFFFFFGLVFSVSDLFINDSIRFNRIKIILNLLCSFSDAIKITCKVQILYFLHVVNRLLLVLNIFYANVPPMRHDLCPKHVKFFKNYRLKYQMGVYHQYQQHFYSSSKSLKTMLFRPDHYDSIDNFMASLS